MGRKVKYGEPTARVQGYIPASFKVWLDEIGVRCGTNLTETLIAVIRTAQDHTDEVKRRAKKTNPAV